MKKFLKVFASCNRALYNLNKDEIRKTIGDLDFVKDNLEEIQFILKDIVFTNEERKNEIIKNQNKM